MTFIDPQEGKQLSHYAEFICAPRQEVSVSVEISTTLEPSNGKSFSCHASMPPARGRQGKEARRTQEIEERKRAAQRDDTRKHTEGTKKKIVFLNEARRRVAAALKTRALSPPQRHHVLEDILTQLDATLTGDEPPQMNCEQRWLITRWSYYRMNACGRHRRTSGRLSRRSPIVLVAMW